MFFPRRWADSIVSDCYGTKFLAIRYPAMGAQLKEVTAAECTAMLRLVLDCLDRTSPEQNGPDAQALSLAALHVQQAIDLIDHPHALDS